MAKIKEGDIFEIETPEGRGYLHYIHKDSTIGELVRVLPGLYAERPSDVSSLAALKERYMIFFPLSAAYKRKIVERIGSYPADNFSMPKYMRDDHNVRGEFLGWHIIDTSTWHRQLVTALTPEQKKLSPWGVWNDTLLVKNLINDWSLEKWG